MTRELDEQALQRAQSIVNNVRTKQLGVLEIHFGGLKKLPPLDDLPFVIAASITFSRGIDLCELAKLTNLQRLSLQFVGKIDLEPIAHLQKLETLEISDCQFPHIEPLRYLTRLEALDLSYTNVTDLRPISGLRNLRSLNLRGTKVSDLMPLSNFFKLESLNVSRTKVTDLRPIAQLYSLEKGARQSGHQYDRHTFGGILYTGAPLTDEIFSGLATLRKKDRTEAVLRYLQGKLDGDNSLFKEDERALSKLSEVPTPFEFSLSAGKAIQATGSSANWPSLPLEISKANLLDRLAASREIADGIIEGLEAGEYQVRREYVRELRRYVAKLPVSPGTGNILLADAAARTLRNLFEADADSLSAGLASSLKTFLEQHIGLRAYYPEIQTFYADVREGKLNAPLPLDATNQIASTVREFTPAVFDSSVSNALNETSSGEDVSVAPPLDDRVTSQHEKILLPPPDPLGQIEPQKAHDLAIAATIGKLWKAFLEGQRINNSLAAWIDVGHRLQPFVDVVVEWYKKHIGI